MVQTQFSHTIKIFCLDNAMEYNEKSFQKFLKQNGRAEHKHCHILETITIRALLISASLPKRFWGEVALTAVYTINRVPSLTIHNQTPYERLYGSTPNYSLLRV